VSIAVTSSSGEPAPGDGDIDLVAQEAQQRPRQVAHTSPARRGCREREIDHHHARGARSREVARPNLRPAIFAVVREEVGDLSS